MMPEEKRTIAQRLLETVKVDRIEVASARVSEGERRAVKTIIDYAESKGLTDRVEILGFVDVNRSVDWAKSVGARVINLLTKGSLHHCREQLRKTHQQHLDDIRKTDRLRRQARDYVQRLSGGLVGRHDRLRGLRPWSTSPRWRDAGAAHHAARHAGPALAAAGARVRRDASSRRFRIGISIIHGHDDYGLGTANTLEAALAGVHGVHVTVNGMGERAGNMTLDEVVVALRDHAGIRTSVDERALVGHQQARRGVLRPPRAGQQADRRRERVHAGGRDPRRRRHEGQPVRKPSDAGAFRAASHLRDGQADGEGEPRLQPRAAEHLAVARAEAAAARAHRRARRSEEERHDLRSAVPDFRSAADARAARLRGEGLLGGQQPRAAADGDDARPLSRQGDSRHRLRATAATTRSCRR